MFRIIKTQFICTDGSIEYSEDVVEVSDIEKHRQSLMTPKYERINFTYYVYECNQENGGNTESPSSHTNSDSV